MRFLFCLFFYSLVSFAGDLVPASQDDKFIEQGKIFKALFLATPQENPSEADWAQVEHEKFSEDFFFVESEKTEQGQLLSLILKKENFPPTLKAQVGTKELSLSIKGFNLKPKSKGSKDFIIREQEDQAWAWLTKERLLWALGILLLLAYPLGKFFYGFYRKKKLQRERRLKKEYWQSLFYSAQSREEFELIGKGKKDWQALLRLSPPEVESYFKVLNEYQYKKHVTSEELGEIKKSLNGMKDVFERYGV